MDVQGVFPPPAVWTKDYVGGLRHQQYGHAGCLSTTCSMDDGLCWVSFHNKQYGRARCLSNALRMDKGPCGVSFHTRSMDEGLCRVSFHHKQYGRAGCKLFNLRRVFVNAGMPDCRLSGESGTGMKTNADPGTSPVPE
jgi:hypothetical protein